MPAVPLLAALLALHPLLQAGFTGDDWTILALARHGGNPLAYYLHDHTIAYSYRPHGMLSWWLVAQLSGSEPFGHYLFALLLHGGNAALLTLTARRFGASPLAALGAGVLYALHPAATGTVAWLSDRYDLLAVTGALATLLALPRAALGGTRGLALLVAAGALAAGSKETAFAAAGAALAWIALRGGDRRIVLACAVLVPFAAAIAMRLVVFGGSGLDRMGALAGGPLDHAHGVWLWLRHLPSVLAGRPGMAGWLAVLLLALPALAAMHRARRVPIDGAAVLAAGVLALAPALLQAPITRLALAGDAPFASITNARFYYLAVAGTLLGFALLFPRRPRAPKASAVATRRAGDWMTSVLAMTSIGAVIAVAGWRSHALAESWRDSTAADERMAINTAARDAAQAVASATPPGQPCRVVLLGGGAASEDFPGFVDTLVKAQLPAGSPALDCIVVGEQAPWVALTAHALSAELAPPSRNSADPLFNARPMLDMVVWFPAVPDELTTAVAHRWDGIRFVRIAATR